MSRPRRLPTVWGATDAEHHRAYDADRLAQAWSAPRRLTRAVDVRAPAPLVYRWLCQLTVAPYSYDWIDHLGRPSPRELTPAADELAAGQRLLTAFTLTGFVPGHSLTMTTSGGGRLLGPVALTYAVDASGPGRSRLVGRLVVDAATRVQRAVATGLAWGDLVMMRRQLHTLRDLAERDAGRGHEGAG